MVKKYVSSFFILVLYYNCSPAFPIVRIRSTRLQPNLAKSYLIQTKHTSTPSKKHANPYYVSPLFKEAITINAQIIALLKEHKNLSEGLVRHVIDSKIELPSELFDEQAIEIENWYNIALTKNEDRITLLQNQLQNSKIPI